MTSIGPQIPQHLLNSRSASPDDADDETSYGPEPPSQPGPQLPPHMLASTSTTPPREAVPQLPAHLVTSSSHVGPPRRSPPAVDDEEDAEDAYAPALPPDLATRPAPPKRTMGPSMPTARYDPDDLSEEDEVGPMPAPAGAHTDSTEDAVREFMEREERRRKAEEEARKSKKLQREEWMLVPPSSTGVLGSLDPTKLKARQFSRSANPAPSTRDNSLWTETPAERQARLKDEVDGKRKRATDVDPEAEDSKRGDRKRSRHDEQVKAQVEEYNKKNRAQTLVDLHQSGKSSGKDKDDGPPVIWDHARDMSVGGRLMDDSQRSKVISEARGLGDRFGKSKGGGFL